MSIRTCKSFIAAIAMAVTLAVNAYTPAAAATLKIATITPEGSGWMKSMREGAREISELTDGRVTVKFYSGGIMGSDKKVLRKIRIGQLQGGAFPAGSLAEIYDGLYLYGLPLLFDSQEEVDYVRQRMDEKIAKGLEESGFVSFGFAGGGFAKLMSNEPVRSLDDLKGRKVWVPEGDAISYAAMESLGLSPVTLPLTDVLTGLQTGLVDIVAASPVAAVVLQWHTKVKFVTDLPVSYIFATLAIEKRAFEKLTAEDQAVFRNVMSGIYQKFEAENRTDNERAAEAMRSNGVEFVEPDVSEASHWRALTSDINDRLSGEKLFNSADLAEIRALQSEFRNTSGVAAGATP